MSRNITFRNIIYIHPKDTKFGIATGYQVIY